MVVESGRKAGPLALSRVLTPPRRHHPRFYSPALPPRGLSPLPTGSPRTCPCSEETWQRRCAATALPTRAAWT